MELESFQIAGWQFQGVIAEQKETINQMNQALPAKDRNIGVKENEILYLKLEDIKQGTITGMKHAGYGGGEQIKNEYKKSSGGSSRVGDGGRDKPRYGVFTIKLSDLPTFEGIKDAEKMIKFIAALERAFSVRALETGTTGSTRS